MESKTQTVGVGLNISHQSSEGVSNPFTICLILLNVSLHTVSRPGAMSLNVLYWNVHIVSKGGS